METNEGFSCLIGPQAAGRFDAVSNCCLGIPWILYIGTNFTMTVIEAENPAAKLMLLILGDETVMECYRMFTGGDMEVEILGSMFTRQGPGSLAVGLRVGFLPNFRVTPAVLLTLFTLLVLSVVYSATGYNCNVTHTPHLICHFLPLVCGHLR
jgi:hypothetical protein